MSESATVVDPFRPDPLQGVFETMLVLEGAPLELDAHLERLAASLDELFDAEPPPGGRELVLERAADLPLGRLRLTVAPAAGGHLEATVMTKAVDATTVFPLPEHAVPLHSLIAKGGLGAHKWADRTLLECSEAEAATGSVPLLFDSDGTVLEASRANIFAVRNGAVMTPPTDGRILAGVARRRTMEIARASVTELREERMALEDLLEADEVFLTGSVRGIEPVRSVDGVALRSVGGVASRLAGKLRRCWLGDS